MQSKFSTEEIYDIFGSDFMIQKIKKTFYKGTFDPLPKALFVVMRLIKKVMINDFNIFLGDLIKTII
jgi:hypothetical protein